MRIRYSISEKWDARDIHEVIDAIAFAIKYYDLHDDKATLSVKLVTGKEDSGEASAYKIKSKRYEIRLSRHHISQGLEPVLLALFHELTHIKQYVKDGFNMYSGSAVFKNKKYTSGDYWLSPWEMEARAMERVLVAKYDEVR